MEENSAYFVRGDDGAEYGPVGADEMREWVAENRVGLGTVVRRDTPDDTWGPWQAYPELVALLAEVHASVGAAAGSLPVLAPLGRRAAAFLFDFLLAYLLVMPLLFDLVYLQPVNLIVQQEQFYQQYFAAIAAGQPPADVTVPYSTTYFIGAELLSFLIPLLYFAGFHARHGRTPAKSLFGLRVTDAAGNKPAFPRALLRAFVLMISIYLYGIPLLYAFFNPQRRALHDIAAGTYVVER